MNSFVQIGSYQCAGAAAIEHDRATAFERKANVARALLDRHLFAAIRIKSDGDNFTRIPGGRQLHGYGLRSDGVAGDFRLSKRAEDGIIVQNINSIERNAEGFGGEVALDQGIAFQMDSGLFAAALEVLDAAATQYEKRHHAEVEGVQKDCWVAVRTENAVRARSVKSFENADRRGIAARARSRGPTPHCCRK